MKSYLIEQYKTCGDNGGQLTEYILSYLSNEPGAKPAITKQHGSLRECIDEFARIALAGDRLRFHQFGENMVITKEEK